MSTIEIIENYQQTLDSLIKDVKGEITYKTHLLPLAFKLFQQLEQSHEYPKQTTIHKPIDIYTEAITLKIVHNYSHNIKEDTLPLNCYVLFIMRYPFLINILQCKRTKKEWIMFREQLLEQITLMFGANKSRYAQLQLVEGMLKSNIESSTNEHILSKFHYLISFHFKEELTGVKASELPRENGSSYFVINVSCNLNNDDSIIVYRRIMQYRCKLLNERTIDGFKSYIKPEKIYKQNDPYYFMDLNFDKHTKCTDRCYVLLCYNDEPEIKDCHFTVALYDKREYVDFDMIQSMIEGQVETILSNIEISDYINNVFNKTFFDEPEDLNQLKEMYSKLSKRVLEIQVYSRMRVF